MYRVFVFCVVLSACNNRQINLPSSAVTDSIFTDKLIDSTNRYLGMSSMDSADLYLNRMEEPIFSSQNIRAKVTWLMNKAQIMQFADKKDSAKYFMGKANFLSKHEVIPDRMLLNFYIVQGSILKKQQLMDSAIRIGNMAYHLSLQLDSFRYTQTCFDLSMIYQELGDLPNLKKYAFAAWATVNEEPELKSFVANAIAYYYDQTGASDSALFFLNRYEEDSSVFNTPDLKASRYENVAYFHNKKGNYKDGLQYQMKAKFLYDSLGTPDAVNFLNLADTYFNLRLFKQAIACVDSAQILATHQSDFSMSKIVWKKKADLLFKMGKYAPAYIAMDSAYSAFGTEMDSSLRNTARDLEVRYSVREKDAAIKVITVANATNFKVRNQQKTIIIILIIAIILAIVTGLLLWKRRQVRIIMREAKLRQQLLSAQMEPHFLFNMLSLLQALIRGNDTEKSVLLLNKLSRLLRSVLANSRETLVLLSDEIAVLESYLTLQSMLKDNKFEYTIDIDFSIQQDAVLIPPMLLQPFAENAIQHGFQNLPEKGILSIKIKIMDGSLYCIIDDNGNGMQQDAVKDGRFHASEITRERLAIFGKQYGHKTKLKLIDKASINAGRGVTVEIIIPLAVAN